MKKLFLVCLSLLILTSCFKPVDENTPKIITTLSGEWEFRNTENEDWMPATVPGTVHTDLLNNGVIDDPYYGTNERHLQWIDKTDWEYRCIFHVDDEMLGKDHIRLLFEGLDTYAEVTLNGRKLLNADNMFRSWEAESRDLLKKGANDLRILLRSPITIGLEKLEANGYPLPASNDQSENGGLGDKKVSIFTRKAGYHFGWDWGPRLVTSGIWRPVKILGYNEALLSGVYVQQSKQEDSVARLTAYIEVESESHFLSRITLSVDREIISEEEFNVREGKQEFRLDFKIQNPELWWPNGSGAQRLYDVQIDLFNISDPRRPLLDKSSTRIGLRTVQLVREPDSTGEGESFYFEVNGNPVFAKGANYIPNDVFLPRFTPDDYRRIVKDAADAHMNMLRVWGGGIYENDIFYDLCDEYGILVWQDFMYACSMYPGDDAFLENARMEAEENIRRLRNHPSIALWCGNNEIEVAWAEGEENKGWGWKERYTPQQRRKIWKDYDTLFHHILPEAVTKYDPHTAYWPSSPSAGKGKLASYENSSGDMHYWGVWHGLHPFEDFRKYRARFMSEYGFQSFPELNTVASYAPQGSWDIESDVMAAHQRSGIGNLRIRQYMEQDYHIPTDFSHFLYVSQLLQAEGIKTAIESHRTDMPYCMGSLYWQLNDCWPVASWSGIDYYGRWKALHYFAKKAFEETILVTFRNEDKLRIYAVSDRMTGQKASLELTLMDFDGNVIWKEQKQALLPGNASKVLEEINAITLLEKGDPGTMLLLSEIYEGEKLLCSDIHYFRKPLELLLPDAKPVVAINVLPDHIEITLHSEKLVKNVFLSTSLSTDHFSDNYFDILPGGKVTVTFPMVEDPEAFKNDLKVLHLGETY